MVIFFIGCVLFAETSVTATTAAEEADVAQEMPATVSERATRLGDVSEPFWRAPGRGQVSRV
jgi:hypothetical protein